MCARRRLRYLRGAVTTILFASYGSSALATEDETWRTFQYMQPLQSKTPLLSGCNATFIDIGANIGHRVSILYNPKLRQGRFTGWFANMSRADVCMLSFEPDPDNHARLLARANAFGRRRLYIFQAAVSERNGVANFSSRTGDKLRVAGSIVRETFEPGITRSVPTATYTVPTVSFDWLLQRHVLPVAMQPGARVFIKFDAEGAEYAAIPAAMKSGALCQSADALQLETHEHMFAGGVETDARLARKARSNWMSTNELAINFKKATKELEGLHAAGRCRTHLIMMDPWKN